MFLFLVIGFCVFLTVSVWFLLYSFLVIAFSVVLTVSVPGHCFQCGSYCIRSWPLLRKTFSKFYRRHYELISKYNVGLKTLLSEGLSEPEFYGDLVYKFKKLKGINDFSFQFRKIITRYRRIGYNLNVMRQSACLVFNPIMVDNYAAFFNCTPVGRASDSMMAPT